MMLVDAMLNQCSHLGSHSENRGIIRSIEKGGEAVVNTDRDEGATNIHINILTVSSLPVHRKSART